MTPNFKRLRGVLASLTAALCPTAAPVLTSALEIEQAQALLPEISVYLHDTDADLAAITPADITATYDGEPVSIESVELSEEGIYYIFLFDVSRSLPEDYLAASKEALMSRVGDLRPQDQLAVISFGTEVHTLLTGGESAEEVQAALDTVHSTDDFTHFYEAVNLLLETTAASPDMRYIAVVVSDGIDTETMFTKSEIEARLRQSGVPIYALSADCATQETMDQFSQFMEVSGGKAFSFNPDNVSDGLGSLMSTVDQVWKLTLNADQAKADGGVHNLSIQIGDGEPAVVGIEVNKTEEEFGRPEIDHYTVDAQAGTITVFFTKEISDITDLSCYAMICGDEKAELTVVKSGADFITLSAPIFDGREWTLNIAGLTDTTENANKVKPGALTIETEQAVSETQKEEAPAETGTPTVAPQTQESGPDLVSLLPFAAIPLAAILLIVLVIVRKRGSAGAAKKSDKGEKKSKNKENTGGVQFYFEDKK